MSLEAAFVLFIKFLLAIAAIVIVVWVIERFA